MSFAPNSLSHFPEEAASSADHNPFDEVDFLPGLGLAVLAVVLAYVFVNLLLLPVQLV